MRPIMWREPPGRSRSILQGPLITVLLDVAVAVEGVVELLSSSPFGVGADFVLPWPDCALPSDEGACDTGADWGRREDG
jgi:hypothetical protein